MAEKSINPILVQVARALAKSQGRADWHEFLSAAQETLRALRDPSDEMLEAASSGLPDWGDLPEGWRAMIDSVLGEADKPFNDNAQVESVKKAAS